MDFKLSAGVGKSDDGSGEGFVCVDEHPSTGIGCPTEAYLLCGFDSASSLSQSVDFLACVDDESGEIQQRAQTCANQQQLDWSSIQSCATGSHGVQLLQAAQNYYESNKDKKHVAGFPTILVDGKEPWSRDYADIMDAICKAGVAAACGSTPTPTPEPSPTPMPSPEPSPVPSPEPSPMPSPTPAPSPTSKHYGKPPCNNDETVATLGDGSVVCAATCSGDEACPTDVPGGKGGLFGPGCGDGSLSKYCVIQCFDDSDCYTAGGSACHSTGGSMGVCAYVSSVIA